MLGFREPGSARSRQGAKGLPQQLCAGPLWEQSKQARPSLPRSDPERGEATPARLPVRAWPCTGSSASARRCSSRASDSPPAHAYLWAVPAPGGPNRPLGGGLRCWALCDLSPAAPLAAPTLPRLPGPAAAAPRAGPQPSHLLPGLLRPPLGGPRAHAQWGEPGPSSKWASGRAWEEGRLGAH